jgi:hypothetical protein
VLDRGHHPALLEMVLDLLDGRGGKRQMRLDGAWARRIHKHDDGFRGSLARGQRRWHRQAFDERTHENVRGRRLHSRSNLYRERQRGFRQRRNRSPGEGDAREQPQRLRAQASRRSGADILPQLPTFWRTTLFPRCLAPSPSFSISRPPPTPCIGSSARRMRTYGWGGEKSTSITVTGWPIPS